MTSKDYINREHKVLANTYDPLPVVLTRGKGSWVWDVEGNKYLDMMTAYSAVSFGHSNDRMLKTLNDQAQKLAIPSRAFHSDQLAPFIEKACQFAGFDMGLPMNSGAEAVEVAIKVARRWGYEVKNIPDDKAEIIVAYNNFHGRTTTIISFSSNSSYKKHFGPFTPGFKLVPFGDAKALEEAITPNTCAFLVEPIQGEAGIIVPPDGYLKEIRNICTENNVLLILDEIQTGLGRTGKKFAYEYEDIHPDGLCLGKALGGGLLPVSLFLGSREMISLMTPGSHGSTFGGNPLACAIGRESLAILEEEHLEERAASLGRHLKEKLLEIESPLIKEVRGKGLLVGVDFHRSFIHAREVCEEMLKHGVLTRDIHDTVVRLAPPLNISKEDLDFGIAGFEQALRNLEREKRASG